MKPFSHIGIGGTFDHLHTGHAAFISKAFELASKVTIGLASDNFVKNKAFSQSILPYSIRKKELEEFLKTHSFDSQAKIVELHDVFGSAATDSTMDAILVTEDNKKNAEVINSIRQENNLKPLEIISFPFVLDEEKNTIESTKIRAGEINRAGKNYKKIFEYILFLPESLREKMREPLGIIVRGDENDLSNASAHVLKFIKEAHATLVIAVGDVIVSCLEENGMSPDISVIDYRTRRHEINIPHKMGLPSYENHAGTINNEAVSALEQAIQKSLEEKKSQTIVISGEEDLLALPAILLAPLGSLVLYGQRDLGVIITEVTEEKKQEVEKLLHQFAT